MEMMAIALSVDILRLCGQIGLGDSFFKVTADPPRTQVVVLDDLPEHPLYDLWSFFASSATIRFRDILEDKTITGAPLSAPQRSYRSLGTATPNPCPRATSTRYQSAANQP